MIQAEQLAFAYPDTDTPVFEDISFSVAQGEVCAILGKNGSGKTTCIKCLTGIFKPQRGRLDVVEPIGYVPQKVSLVYDMTVLDAIVMGRYRYNGAFSLPRKADYDVARSCADQLKITDLLEKNFSKLSGGQQQLVMVARALAVEPQCIVFDEPCSALDYGNQNHILSIIGSLREKRITAVFSTHDPNHALHTADKVLVIKQRPDYSFGPTEAMMTEQALSSLYGMQMKQVQVNDDTTSVLALFDQRDVRKQDEHEQR